MPKSDRAPRTFLAEIRWKSSDEGGRTSLPSGVERPPYAPIVRPLDSEVGRSDATRSLSVQKLEGDDELTDDGAEWLAEIACGAEDALPVGCRFELYEGANCVAIGVVIGFSGDQSACSAMIGPFDR